MTSCWELRNEVRYRCGDVMRCKVQPRVSVTFTLKAVPFAAHGIFVERGWMHLRRSTRTTSTDGVDGAGAGYREMVKLVAMRGRT